MGDRLRAGKPPQYFTEPPRPTQPPTLSGTGNERRYGLRLGNKGRMAYSMWLNVWVADNTAIRHNADLGALEMSITHIIKRCTNVLLTYC